MTITVSPYTSKIAKLLDGFYITIACWIECKHWLLCASGVKSPSPDNDRESNHEDLSLARKAADGDEPSRRTINRLVHPIITFQTKRFCMQFCHGNRYRYVCTLQSSSVSRSPKGALLCEFGNASYAWMLEDLTKPKRLLRFEGRNGARLNNYLFYIANSLPFYERWKDWRLGRKVHVPTYIKEISPSAGKVFLLLCDQIPVADISRRLDMGDVETEQMCQSIIAELTKRHRLYLLDRPRTVSLTSDDAKSHMPQGHDGQEMDIRFCDEDPEVREEKQLLRKAWEHLSGVEQFVLEAMVIDEQDAADVLDALRKLDISIKEGVAPKDTNRQQLYYFRRKTLSKLTGLMQGNNE